MAFSRKIIFLPTLLKNNFRPYALCFCFALPKLFGGKKKNNKNSGRLTLLFKSLINLKLFKHFFKQNT